MRRRLRIGALAWNAPAGAIVGQAAPGQLTGLFLPSLQRFTIRLPSAIVKPPSVSEKTLVYSRELTSGALYVQDGGGPARFWRTASPTVLPLNTSRPRLTRSGRALTCRRGSWRHADRFSYAWLVNGIAHKRASRTLAVGKVRRLRRVSCSVTASNSDGATTASSAPLHAQGT